MLPNNRIIQNFSEENINYGTLRNLPPLVLVRQITRCFDNTCLQVLSNRIYWWLYIRVRKDYIRYSFRRTHGTVGKAFASLVPSSVFIQSGNIHTTKICFDRWMLQIIYRTPWISRDLLANWARIPLCWSWFRKWWKKWWNHFFWFLKELMN